MLSKQVLNSCGLGQSQSFFVTKHKEVGLFPSLWTFSAWHTVDIQKTFVAGMNFIVCVYEYLGLEWGNNKEIINTSVFTECLFWSATTSHFI